MSEVKIARLKAHLSEYLRRVQLGHRFTVCDRSNPIAELVPLGESASSLQVRRPLGRARLGAIPLPPPLGRDVDVLRLLDDERQSHR